MKIGDTAIWTDEDGNTREVIITRIGWNNEFVWFRLENGMIMSNWAKNVVVKEKVDHQKNDGQLKINLTET